MRRYTFYDHRKCTPLEHALRPDNMNGYEGLDKFKATREQGVKEAKHLGMVAGSLYSTRPCHIRNSDL